FVRDVHAFFALSRGCDDDSINIDDGLIKKRIVYQDASLGMRVSSPLAPIPHGARRKSKFNMKNVIFSANFLAFKVLFEFVIDFKTSGG
ncbi:MAG: hypothetical protein SGI77_09120, partial [Pirellulaceae bacterium]|nr:hypothetical protein [Pirellulaceae bacterium]